MMGAVLRLAFADHFAKQFAANPALAVERAALGDVAALRALVAQGLEVIATDDDPDIQAIAFAEAIAFARLAAVHGGTEDRHALLKLLCDFAALQAERGRQDIANRLEACGLLVAETLADEGDEHLAEMIAKAGATLPAEVFEEVQRLRESM